MKTFEEWLNLNQDYREEQARYNEKMTKEKKEKKKKSTLKDQRLAQLASISLNKKKD